MPYSFILAQLREKIGSLVLFGVLTAAVTFFLTTAFSPRYIVETDFMVVQSSNSQDYYTLFKSSEFLSRVLGETLYSDRFIDAIIGTGKVNEKTFLPINKRDRLNAWRSLVTVNKNAELGMLRVGVKADSEKAAGTVMDAITDVLVNHNQDFRGGDPNAVRIQVLTGPITDRNPKPSQLVLIAALGFLGGVFLRLLPIVLRSGVRRS